MNQKNLDTYLDEIKQRVKSKVSIEDIRDLSYPNQDKFVLDDSQFVTALCTRRAGKSTGLGLRFVRTMLKYPGSSCPYIALTRESAKNIMWPILIEINDRFKLGAVFTESNLTMTLPNQAKLQLFGADMKNFIKRLKGTKAPGVAIDEAQDFGSHIESLVDDVLTPTIGDYKDGWLAVTGTPGPVPRGYFHEITEKKKYGYSLHSWSLFDNPYLPDPKGFVDRLIKKKGWAPSNPTLLREYYGKWVLDIDALVFKYSQKNHYDSIPELEGKWEYIIGVDLGFDDADAIAVIGWHPRIKEAYLIEEHVDANQGITELAEKIEKLIKVYDPLRVVMDTGGLGKKIAEEIQKRYALPIQAAEKTRKFEYIELLNDALRTKKFFAKNTSRFAEDTTLVKWDAEALDLKISNDFHSDICDAVLYAFRESLHWTHEAEKPKVQINSAEWFREQAQNMEDELVKQLEEKKSIDIWGDMGSDFTNDS